MMDPSPEARPEKSAWLAFLPILATLLYYVLPAALQQDLWITFSPQLLAYASLVAWALLNSGWRTLLRLDVQRIGPSLKWGALVGVALGAVNLSLILLIIPALGGDVQFLQETPHAKAPAWVMFPVGIVVIGILVELNFRGFQMGRLLTLLGQSSSGKLGAILVSALAFSFDPFMVRVFHHLHWIAVWDGLVYGVLLLQTRSLYATMAAHTVEVWILYVWLKLWLT
jgi:membrane protease YdiL (CAAX protease family)